MRAANTQGREHGIETVTVIGAGTMGAAIAGHLANAGVQFFFNYRFHFLLLVILKLLQPGRMIVLNHQLGKQGQGFFAIAPNRHMRFHVFVDFRRIDVEVDDRSLFGVLVEPAGHAPELDCHLLGGLVVQEIGDNDVRSGTDGFDLGGNRMQTISIAATDNHLVAVSGEFERDPAADPATAAGREITPHALAGAVLAGSRIFRRHLRPVALKLFGDELGEAGE